jgi:hypothetical protein
MGETDQMTEQPATEPDNSVLNDFLRSFQAQRALQQHQAAYAEGGEVSQPNPTGGITPEIEFLLNNFVADTRPQPMMQPQPVMQQSPLAALQQNPQQFGR